MNLSKIVLAVALGGSFSTSVFADTNVALGANVVTNGPGFDLPSVTWGAGNFQPSSIVNGTPLPDGTQWNEGTAFWTGSSSGDVADTITITLAALSNINSIQLQADDNDSYNVSYLSGSNWVNLTTIGTSGSWGLATRPILTLGSPITTSEFQITAAGGDGYYAVGQFIANGTIAAVPEPETYAMMFAGLGLLGFMVRRQKNSDA